MFFSSFLPFFVMVICVMCVSFDVGWMMCSKLDGVDFYMLFNLSPPASHPQSNTNLLPLRLVWEHLLNSYTIVPPVVIQRKISKTDITLEGGAVWKEKLNEGVLGTTESGDEV